MAECIDDEVKPKTKKLSKFKRLKEKFSQGHSTKISTHRGPPVVHDKNKLVKNILRKVFKRQRSLKILITGKTGQGKSSLVNGLLGRQVATEGARAARCTTEVEMYARTIEGVNIKVFDSPGLQDRTENEKEYIKRMSEKCKELSLVLYCTKMINTRLTDDDKNAMIKLTAAFGEGFWDYAVFVLTFANMEDVERKDDRDDKDDEEPDDDDDEGWKELGKKRFEGRLKIWKESLQNFLIKEVRVSPDIAKSIPVIPTGDNKESHDNPEPFRLPDREDWFHNFWEVCCQQVKETSLLLKLNKHRLVPDISPAAPLTPVAVDDPKPKPAEQQKEDFTKIKRQGRFQIAKKMFERPIQLNDSHARKIIQKEARKLAEDDQETAEINEILKTSQLGTELLMEVLEETD